MSCLLSNKSLQAAQDFQNSHTKFHASLLASPCLLAVSIFDPRYRVVQKCVHLVIEAAAFRVFLHPENPFHVSLSDRACRIERGAATDTSGFAFESFIICVGFAEDCA